MTRSVLLCTLFVGFTLAQIAQAQRLGGLPIDSLGTLGPTHISDIGDLETGLQWNGADAFANPFVRYFLQPNFALDASAEIDRRNDDGTGSDPSLYRFSLGGLYELGDHPSHRCYVRPRATYERNVFDSGGSRITQNDFGGAIGLGGDVRIKKNFLLGMEVGAEYSTFSTDIETGETSEEGPGGNKFWGGFYNRVNATFRFPND